MKIFIQARKDGYNVLYPKPTPQEFFNFGSDIQRIDAQTQSCFYGKEFYSLAFSSTGRIFSKYVIGYDVQRGAVGYIAFSIFIPQDKTLSGQDVKALLDTLAGTYIQNYSSNFYFDSKKNEDWNLFADIANGFESHLKRLSDEDVESVTPGSETPAFVFYRTEEELSRYLDDHYQSEYYPYQQVYFVDIKYEGQKDNPLSIAKINPQANLTGRIDLDNPKYRIEFESSLTQNGNRIKVEVNNGAYWKQIFSKNKVRRKNAIRISWTKDCYEPKVLTGTLAELSDSECINIDNGTVHIKDVDLPPVKKSIKITANDPKGQPIRKPTIVCSNSDKERKFDENGIITFVGEDIRCPLTITVNSGNMSGSARIIPVNSPDCIPITVHEKKSIEVSVIDINTYEPITDFEVWTKHRGGFSKDKTIVFIDDDIDQDAQITVKSKGYKQKDLKFNPREYDGNITLKLSKKENTNDGKQPASWLKRHSKCIVSICALVLCITAYYICRPVFVSNNETSKNDDLWSKRRVDQYLIGDSLILNQLDTCIRSLEKAKQKSKTRSSSRRNKDNGNDNELESYKGALDNANNILNLRKHIDNNDWIGFADCNDSLFSGNSSLQGLKSIVIATGKKKLEQINIPNIDKLPLNDVRKKVEEQIYSINIESLDKNSNTNVTRNGSNTIKSALAKDNTQMDSEPSKEEQDIISYLKSSNWTKQKLEGYLKSTHNSDIVNELNLALELWNLDGTENTKNTYYSYNEKIKKNSLYIKDNKNLRELVDEQIKLENNAVYIKNKIPNEQQEKLTLTMIKKQLGNENN